MIDLEQNETPLFDAVKKYVDSKVIQFHVPGHKQGIGIEEFREYIGEIALRMDANGMEDLDYANNPTGVILKAEKLLAAAFGAEEAHFLVNGTTSGVQAMIMSICGTGDEIILPRNAHRSAISGIILSGAMPVYVQPKVNTRLGIAMGVTVENVIEAIGKHPKAKAVFVINPTYYGPTSDIKSIVEAAHKNNMAVLADEAHGAHMYFHEDFPMPAIKAGADLSAASTHKTAGSMTQSSVLMIKSNIVSKDRLRQILNLSFTSSASYLLMCSIDVARKQLALRGHSMLEKTLELARWVRGELNKIDGVYAFGKELIDGAGCFAFDETKLGINVKGLGLTGYQLESILRKDYNIQIELADLYNTLALITIGDRMETVEALYYALKDISAKRKVNFYKEDAFIPCTPKAVVTPRTAFYSSKKVMKLEEAAGQISGEMIMAYPPGIPIICMGEEITKEVIEYIGILKEEKCHLQGTSDPYVNFIRVLNLK